MAALALPPAALIAFDAEGILSAWTGNASLAAGAGPILRVLVLGTAMSVCAYPALNVLYARDRLRPVIQINLGLLFAWMPALVISMLHFGAMGAAYCWLGSGIFTFLAYQLASANEGSSLTLRRTIRDFATIAASSGLIAALAGKSLERTEARLAFAALLCFWLCVAWIAAFLAIRELREILFGTLRWQIKPL
jgi:hypothetical protein